MKTERTMKTGRSIVSAVARVAFAVMLLIGIASCGGDKVPSAEEVANKIEDGQKLTEGDYTAMIDYCGEYAQQVQKYFDIVNKEPNDSTSAAVEATDAAAALYEKYTYLDQFRTVLAQTELSALGKENEKKVREFAKYEGFPLPVGAGADLTDPNVVGDIEQMPDTAVTDSTGVISTGAGEAVDVSVK